MATDFNDAATWIGILAVVSSWWALWVRRRTWGHYFEAGATTAVLLLGLALPIASPYATNTVGRWLFDITGIGGLNTVVGNLMYLGSTASFIVHMQIRDPAIGRDNHRLHAVLKQKLCLPLTLAVNIMLALVVMSPRTEGHMVDLPKVDCGPWLMAYWILWCATGVYLQIYLALLLLDLRIDRRSRRWADCYLVAVLFSLIAYVMTVVVRLYNDHGEEAYIWLIGSVAVTVFSIGTGVSWLSKVHGHRRRAAVVWNSPQENRIRARKARVHTRELREENRRIRDQVERDWQVRLGIPELDASLGDQRADNRGEPPLTSDP